MAKYIIMMLCDDGDGDIYTDYVNMLFDDRKEAEDYMERCIQQELECLNDNPADWKIYTREGNTICRLGCRLTEYNIAEITNEYKKEEDSVETDEISKLYPEITPEMYDKALVMFRHFFEIDDNDEEYACGSLEKLAIILGKDYRYSDLIYEIAQNFEETFDPEFDVTLNAWESSIKEVVDYEKYEMAFEEWYPDIPDISDVIRSYQEDLDFSNRDIEYIEENERLMAAIFFAIVEYLDEEEISWCDISFEKYSTSEWTTGVLNVIEKTYKNF